jgi:hypothetical protein
MSDETASLKCAADTLKARRGRILADLQEINAAITALEKEIRRAPEFTVVEVKDLAPSDAASVIPLGGAYSMMGVPDAVVDFLKKSAKPVAPAVVVEGLKANGLQKKSTNLYRLIYNTLWERSRRANPDIRKVGRKWAYREPQGT